MSPTTVPGLAKSVWALACRQHGVVARWQLLELGYSADAIRHRIRVGRLHQIHRGVYAVGRPEITREGRWMAAVLACGPGAVLSHGNAAVLWGLSEGQRGPIEISVPRTRRCRIPQLTVHRRHPKALADATTHNRIPVTGPVRTLVDLAARAARPELETLINQADKLDLIHPEQLRSALDNLKGEPGVPALREVLDLSTFTLTDSELERLFLPIARRVGLPNPETRQYVNGFRVDFYWPDLGLVVETDGLRYHRTPAQQARQALRDNAHVESGLTPLRFTHAQVRYQPGYVEATLARIVGSIAGRS